MYIIKHIGRNDDYLTFVDTCDELRAMLPNDLTDAVRVMASMEAIEIDFDPSTETFVANGTHAISHKIQFKPLTDFVDVANSGWVLVEKEYKK